MLEQLGHENVTVFKGLKKALPDVDNNTIQSMTATIMIACDKGTVYTPGDFDIADYEAPKPKTETKVEAPIGNGKTEEQIAQDVKERGGDLPGVTPEQRAELERLAKMPTPPQWITRTRRARSWRRRRRTRSSLTTRWRRSGYAARAARARTSTK